ncbi:DNA polymerase III subunit delta' C-terminal domain-containing protein [Buchnera aphidicola (Chaitoregma tattakana)]|uniref:DNA polymerase III subunit delta' C-terminal domain-containing protein n=1 Tax=Buchnera aphidicola TaxID=9 RepID=UPI0031B89413
MQNKLYPWLLKYYEKIITMLKNRRHHSILINSSKHIGINNLIFKIKTWFFCKNIVNKYSCNTCNTCVLIKKNKYSDIYNLNLYKKIGVQLLRETIEKILLTSKHGLEKIVFIKNSDLLTDLESNILLKIIEETPKNTIFILQTYKVKNLMLTLKSRMYIVRIFDPEKKTSVKWLLKTTNFSYKDCSNALQLSNNRPIYAKKILLNNLLKIRKNFYKILSISIEKNNLIILINTIEKNSICFFLNLIYTIFLDAIKYKNNIMKHIINNDQKKLIKKITKKIKNKEIYHIIKSWMQFENNVTNIKRINYELILLEQILKFEQILKNKIKNYLLPKT